MKIREMQLLVRVAESGSMTQAARQLDLTPAAVSAAIQRIESALGMRLFERTTRSLHPTREGLVVIEGCKDTVGRWTRTLDEARGSEATFEGTLRIAAPADTAHQLLSEPIAAFSIEHPAVRVVVHATDTLQNVIQDALDVSIRYGQLADSTLVARRLAESPRLLVASPSYIAAHGVPHTPHDLLSHRLLTLQLGNSPERSWSLLRAKEAVELAVDSPLCGNGLLIRQWALAGHGIAFKSLIDVVDDLEAGRLVRVLPDFDGGVSAVHAMFPSRQFIPARVRALVDHLAQGLAAREARSNAWLGVTSTP